MHFIQITDSVCDKQGNFASFKLGFQPVTFNKETDQTLYVELWHRIRRHHRYLAIKERRDMVFDAGLYLSPLDDEESLVGEKSSSYLEAVLMRNCAKTVKIDHELSVKKGIKALHLLDKLLSNLSEDDIAVITSSSPKEVKAFLKTYCRGQGLLINEDDLSRAKQQEKELRRANYEKAAALLTAH